jgi:hypothetical protein
MLITITPAIYFAGLFLIVSDVAASDFDDIGKLMLGGFLAAIAVALLFTFIKLRLRDKRPRGSDFLSINSQDKP